MESQVSALVHTHTLSTHSDTLPSVNESDFRMPEHSFAFLDSCVQIQSQDLNSSFECSNQRLNWIIDQVDQHSIGLGICASS